MKIRGVVDASGGASRTGDDPWLLSLVLHPWRDAGGELIGGKAIVWRCCHSDAELETAESERSPGLIVEVEVETPERLPGLEFRLRGSEEFAYVEHSVVEDAELARFARALAPPAEVIDEVLGTFVFDPRLRWYSGRHRRASYRIRVTPPDPRQPGPRIQQARAIVAWIDAHRDAIGRAVADELWPTWDGSWRQDDEDDIDREAFERRLSLISVAWDEDQNEGDFSLSFADGDLFGGHGIAVAVEGFVVRSAELYG